MTLEEAKMQIQAIPEKIWDQLSEPDREAMEMAFSALQAQDVPDINVGDMISRQTAIEALKEKRNSAKEWYEEASASGDEMMLSRAESAMMTFVECILTIKKLPSAQPEIVRCKDCKYRGGLSGCYCDIVGGMVGVDSFCSWAERRTNGSD